ncbi:GNAT family N-acetyltransferase [Nibrella saemangeumensis]|uniref:GNAT family N-acetyltransferase n=1 Tax=Nibrella saemangeumensis TaxID=1084526 RepID=A0ABP8MM77_9BACT
MNLDNATVQNNTAENRFEMLTDGKLSVVEYQPYDDNTLVLTHTEVALELEGQGIGSRLVKETLEYVRQHNLQVIPLCPFVSTYLKRHRDYVDVVHPAYKDKF